MPVSSGDDYTTLWLPNEVMRERATVPAVTDLDAVDGFIQAHYEYTREDGSRHYALTNRRDFQRIVDGYGCPKCLAKFRQSRNDCPLCDWTRDLSRDIVDQIPPEWVDQTGRTSDEILAS